VLAGVLAFGHGYKLSNPIAAFQRATFAELSRLAGLIAHLTARRDELTELLTRHENELAQVQANANTAKAAATALAAELRAHARTEMHRSLGDPATGGMTAALTATTDPEHTS
jgi:septal ring factor EnvC (AmiA/AmiB activator)